MAEEIFVTRAVLPTLEEYTNEIKDIWESHWLTNMGVKHIAFQRALREYLGVEGIELFTNGHMALELSLQALNLQGEVITTPFTFASTTHAIVRNRLTPVFCDIKENDFTIDETKIEQLITPRTCAIMPVHVYGNVCNIEAIQALADKYGLKVIFDAAHTFGVKYKGKSLAGYGDVSCYSFHATKVFNTIEGGAACFKDKELGVRLYRLKNFGIKNEETVDGIGANAKMNEFCAAMGLCNLRHIDEEITARSKVYRRYYDQLNGVRGLRLNAEQADVEPNYGYFPLLVDEREFGASRNEIFVRLTRAGIHPRKYFYPLTNTFDCFGGQYDVMQTPVALKISRRVLTLPLYAGLPLAAVDRICQIIMESR